MPRFFVQLQDFYEGKWLLLGLPLAVDADSPSAALAHVDPTSIGLRPGVTYRLSITGPDGEVLTDPVQAPDFPAPVAA